MFVEMLLVRWVGTELRVFAYLQNAVLVAAFLGLGLGCRNARVPVRLLPAMLCFTAIALVLDDPWGWDLGEGITRGLVAFQNSGVWYVSTAGEALPQYVRTALVVFALLLSLALLAAIAAVFRPLGQWLGSWMDAHPRPIAAYTANILGSLLGIALFVWATVLGTRPFLWLLAAGIGLAACARWASDRKVARAASVGLALALPLFAWRQPHPTRWSPYQKLSLQTLAYLGPDSRPVTCGEVINVNNVGYQSMLNLDGAHMATDPVSYPPGEIRTSHYILPYGLVGTPKDVLIVGSGAGNDVAAALRAGAGTVQAVEIDPAIVALGRARHPNNPYASPRVKVTVDDARAFFRKDTGPYDLVWFGLLDSHTTPSAYANVRLDHFVYTRESFADVKRLLRPSGVVVLFFAPQTEWISARLVGLLGETFGTAPLALSVSSSTPCLGWGGLLLVGGPEQALAPVRARAQADAELRARMIDTRTFPAHTVLTSDDWPYLYLPEPGIPRYHLLVGLACLVLGLLLRGALFKPGESIDPAMLLLGMGFMLLEVTGVSRAALLFGTTWTVNAYVVGAIFAMILLANLVASRVAIRSLGWPAAGLVLSILAEALVPTASLAALPLALRTILGGGFLALPVFFSGLIFVSAWARSERKDLALGSNLLGSLLGGVASMLSMAVGFRLLTFLTLAVYLGALLALRREPAASPAPAEAGA